MTNKLNISAKNDAARRLKIVNGHLHKVIQMVEADEYCIDILQQTSAIKSAIKKAEEVLLENHINHCVVKAIKSNAEKKAIEELIKVYKKVD